jgi:ribonuclease P protein component
MSFKSLFTSLFRPKLATRPSRRESTYFCGRIPGLKLVKLKKSNESPGKLLIIIPRKTGKAVARNKLRRQIKAIFYEEKLYQKPGTFIVVVYKEAAELSFQEIRSFMIERFEQQKPPNPQNP